MMRCAYNGKVHLEEHSDEGCNPWYRLAAVAARYSFLAQLARPPADSFSLGPSVLECSFDLD